MKKKLKPTITVLFSILFICTLGGFYLSLQPPPLFDLTQAFAPPTVASLGRDPYGVPLSQRLLIGCWHSLQVALLVVLFTTTIGITIGTFLSVLPSTLTKICLRLIDVFLSFPGLLLAILIASLMPPSTLTVIVSLTVTGWAGHARLTRALLQQTLPLPFVEASRAAGASFPWLFRYELFPALRPQLLTQCVFQISGVILGEASLSFLGLGGSFGEQPSLGALIAEGRDYLVEAPHLSLFAGLMLFFVVMTFQLLGQYFDRSRP